MTIKTLIKDFIYYWRWFTTTCIFKYVSIDVRSDRIAVISCLTLERPRTLSYIHGPSGHFDRRKKNLYYSFHRYENLHTYVKSKIKWGNC